MMPGTTDSLRLDELHRVESCAGPTKDDFTKLSAIADTVVFGKDYVDCGIPWDVQAEIVGRAVGRPEAMAEKVASSKKALTDAAAANPAFSRKTSMVITPHEGLWVDGAQDPRVRLRGTSRIRALLSHVVGPTLP